MCAERSISDPSGSTALHVNIDYRGTLLPKNKYEKPALVKDHSHTWFAIFSFKIITMQIGKRLRLCLCHVRRKTRLVFVSLIVVIGFIAWYYSSTTRRWTPWSTVNSSLTDHQNNFLLATVEKKTYTPCSKKEHEWNGYHQQEITQIKTKLTLFMNTVDPYPLDRFKGKGIVTSAQKSVYPRLLATLRLLRWFQSALPVEVFVFSDEINVQYLSDLQSIDKVRVNVMNTTQSLQNRQKNEYAVKLHAILQSQFEHILWLDGDNIPVRDPEYLFNLPHYTSSAAIFWPDFWTSSENNPIWKIMGLQCRAEDYEQESGQILINKRLSWKALHLAMYLNGSPRIMGLLLGDKDTFRLSWRAMNTSFFFIRKYLSIAGFYHRAVGNNKPREFCGHTMVQHDPFGQILFLHGNFMKYQLNIKFSPEPKYPELANTSNPWRILSRYANSASYLTASIHRKFGYLCTAFPTTGPPLYEEDFHRLISPTVTMMYLRFLNEKTNHTNTSSYASIVDW